MAISDKVIGCCGSNKTMLLGVALTMAANALHLYASYLVKVNTITATDNLIFRASVQTVAFGVWTVGSAVHLRCQQTNHIIAPESDVREPNGKSWLAAVICNFSMSTTILLQFVAVKMLPLSDFVTFQFTAPVFAMMATTCVMRSRPPLIGFLFILVIFLGDCLVAQPSFLFGTSTADSIYQDTYAIGTVLTFVVAVGSGCYRVLQATSRLVPTWEFMFIGGLTSLAIGFLCPVMGMPSNLFDWAYFAANFWKLLAISVASLSSALLLLIAVKTTGNPVLVSVVRTTEILMSLVLDTIFSDAESTVGFWIKVVGAMLVISQIICITLIDKIQYLIDTRIFGRPVKRDYERIRGTAGDEPSSQCDIENNNTERTSLLKSTRSNSPLMS